MQNSIFDRCYDAVSVVERRVCIPRQSSSILKTLSTHLITTVSCTLLDALVVSAAMTIRNRNYGCHQAVLSRYYGTLFLGIDSGSVEK